MALDSRYIIASDLESAFLDKDTALPLANGTIWYKSDNDQTTLKPIYELTGTPPNYTYTPLPNPVVLNAAGQVVNNSGDVVVPYYFPYDANGDPEYYYIEIFNASSATPQKTQKGWPNAPIPGGTNTNIDEVNYVANPQFWPHSDLYQVSIPDPTVGKVWTDEHAVAQGQWYFARGASSTATDFVTFDRIGSYTDNPSESPRYACRVQCTVIDGTDTYKRLECRFDDVNTFASDTQFYTFAVWMKGNANDKADLAIKKYYGTGGSPSATEVLIKKSVNVTTSYALYQVSFAFGENSAKAIGTNNDDYIALVIDFAPTSTFDVYATDVVLTPHSITLTDFPVRTASETQALSLTSNLPIAAVDGSDLYLPMIKTRSGMAFWKGLVGKIFLEYRESAMWGPSLECTGAQFPTNGYSSEGVPYARLQSYLWDATAFIPITGTGPDYFSTLVSPTTASELIVSNNTAGAYTATSDGSTATGFTFVAAAPGVSALKFKAYRSENNVILEATKLAQGSPITVVSGNTTGWTVAIDSLYPAHTAAAEPDVLMRYTITPQAASSLSGGEKIQFSVPDGASGTENAYIWFKKGATGSDPGGTGTAIECRVETSDDATTVLYRVMMALNQWQTSTITCVAAGSIPDRSYFNVYSSTSHYIVWYQVNSSSEKPTTSADRYIKVTLTGSESNTAVAAATRTAMNMENFAVPDLRGLFLRGKDSTPIYDLETAKRYSNVPGIYGNMVGTFQRDAVMEHIHTYTKNTIANISHASGGTLTPGDNTAVTDDTSITGLYESRPRNAYVTPVIML